ncbi:MAG: hypothetical protein ABF311_10710, partial [Polaribacter sp.]
MTKKTLFFNCFLAILCFSCKNDAASSLITFDKLLVNTKQNPIAIENKQPDFSWIVGTDGYNKSQSAYQILVASTEENLNESDADIWNSNKVKSDKSAFVK